MTPEFHFASSGSATAAAGVMQQAVVDILQRELASFQTDAAG